MFIFFVLLHVYFIIINKFFFQGVSLILLSNYSYNILLLVVNPIKIVSILFFIMQTFDVLLSLVISCNFELLLKFDSHVKSYELS